ncbi:MAG TPA: S4 domain-containing protein [Alphaproteobacteria bacterium]|nr:S4 domain-containing protein [Alphaproteobacteria bacterium]
MVKRHLKRINAPKTWKIQRKGIKFTAKTNPGGMSRSMTMPISNVLKYELNIGTSTKDVKHLIKAGEILVNGVKITDYRHPLCFTDVLSLPKVSKYFRLIIDTNGILKPVAISKEESALKITKIIGKTLVKGKIQLNLLDGRNVLFDKQHYKVKDSLLITIPEQLIKEHLTFEKGALVLLYKGKHIGKVGKVNDVKGDNIFIKTKTEEFETKTEYALVIGKEHSLVKMTEDKQ